MKKNLRFLVAVQASTVAVSLIFGLWVAMLRDVNPGDFKTIQSRVDAASELPQLKEYGSLLVKVLEQKESRYKSLCMMFLIFITAFGLSTLGNTLIATAILKKFKRAGYEDPSVVLGRF